MNKPGPVIRFVGDTPVITLGDGPDDESAIHRLSFMPSPWRGWCWRCRCGARGSTRTHDEMMAAVAAHLRRLGS
jgi:hypothetical protein